MVLRLPRVVQALQPEELSTSDGLTVVGKPQRCWKKAVGKPCAGKLHARFDEGPLRRSFQISGLLYEGTAFVLVSIYYLIVLSFIVIIRRAAGEENLPFPWLRLVAFR